MSAGSHEVLKAPPESSKPRKKPFDLSVCGRPKTILSSVTAMYAALFSLAVNPSLLSLRPSRTTAKRPQTSPSYDFHPDLDVASLGRLQLQRETGESLSFSADTSRSPMSSRCRSARRPTNVHKFRGRQAPGLP